MSSLTRPRTGPRIFISYRRANDGGLALLLRSALESELGEGTVFLDERSIQPGEEFHWAIGRAASVCEAMILLIGQDWTPKRLDVPHLFGNLDFVRHELDIALRRGIPLLPVLLDGTPFPSKADLPNDLAGLTAHQALAMTRDQPAEGFREIVRVLRGWLGAGEGPAPTTLPSQDQPMTALAEATADGLGTPTDPLQEWQEARRRNESDPAVWCRLAAHLAEHGLSVEAEDAYRRVLECGSDRDQGLWLAIGAYGLSKICEERGEYVLAEQHVSRGLAALLSSTDAEAAGRPGLEIELVVSGESPLPTATEARARLDAVEAMVRCASIRHVQVLSSLYSRLGSLAETKGDLSRAEYCHHFALTVCMHSSDVEGYGISTLNLGSLARWQGDLTGAEGWYRRALRLAEEAELRILIATAKARLARVHQDRGQLTEAEKLLQEGIDLADEERNVPLRTDLLRDLANLHQQRGSVDLAENLHFEVLSLERRLHRQPKIASQYHNLANLAYTKGDVEAAEAMYLQALGINEAIGRREGVALQKSCLGLIYADRGQLDRAEAELSAAKTIYEELGHTRGLGQALFNLGHVRELGAQPELAEQLYRRAASLLDAAGEPDLQAKAWLRAGMVSFGTGSGVQGTYDALRNAYRRASAANNTKLMGEACAGLGLLFEAAEQFDQARLFYEESMKHLDKIAPQQSAEVAKRLHELEGRTG